MSNTNAHLIRNRGNRRNVLTDNITYGPDGEPTFTDPRDPVASTDNPMIDYAIKPLDSHFSSFGEAVFSFVNCNGYNTGKHVNTEMPVYFCQAIGIPYNYWGSDGMDRQRYYFTSLEWLLKYLDDNNWIRAGLCTYYKVDEFNRPIAGIDYNNGKFVRVEIKGSLNLVVEFMELAKANVVFDPTVPYETNYVEIGIQRGNSSLPNLQCFNGGIKHNRTALPEYYPYLDGGIEGLIKDFIESDDTVLILMGPPGTGKSTAVMSGARTLGLKPIYANNAEVIQHPDFVTYAFNTLDSFINQVNDPCEKRNVELYDMTPVIERHGGMDETKVYRLPEDPHYGLTNAEINDNFPLIVIEDGDALMAPRKGGNLVMNNLLNQTDGVSSSTNRKIIFNTNLKDISDIDEGLLRTGRCYSGAPINFRLLTPDEAIVARKAAGLPDFENIPTKDMSLAEALLKPRKKIVLEKPKPRLGFSL